MNWERDRQARRVVGKRSRETGNSIHSRKGGIRAEGGSIVHSRIGLPA